MLYSDSLKYRYRFFWNKVSTSYAPMVQETKGECNDAKNKLQ